MGNWQRQLRFYSDTVFGSGLFAALLIACFLIAFFG